MNKLKNILNKVGMKTVTIFFLVMMVQVLGYTQSNLSTTLSITSENEESICADVEITNNNNEEIKILGQNVRLFYDSKNLSIDNITLSEGTAPSSYSLEIISEESNLSKKGGAQLSFEDNLGYVNYNVNLDYDYLFDGLIHPTETLSVQSVCFNKKNKDVSIDAIVLAEDGITNKYSRAFTVIESAPTKQDLILPTTLTDLEYQEELASLNQ